MMNTTPPNQQHQHQHHEDDNMGITPVFLSHMFINSTDTLRKRPIPQQLPPTWNDKPPLFFSEQQKPKPSKPFWSKWQTAGGAVVAAATNTLNGGGDYHASSNSTMTDSSSTTTTGPTTGPSSNAKDGTTIPEEDPKLLKGMIRQGIPPPLKCAVWLSNIVQAAHPHEPFSFCQTYRTLAKVQVLDHAYDVLWENNNSNNNNNNNNGEHENTTTTSSGMTLQKGNVRPVSFGRTEQDAELFWNRIQEYPGKEALERVLYALQHVLVGVDYAPMIPSLCEVLLGHMSESYVFCAIREMTLHNTWFFACSPSEHVGYAKTLMDVLEKLHPHSAQTLKDQGMQDDYAKAIFQDFFTTLLKEEDVGHVMDIYSLEGMKVLFRMGVALIVMYQREWKEHYIYQGTDVDKYWKGLVDFSRNHMQWNMLVKKAYGVHGKGIRKRYRFPRRPILQRIIHLEEERYYHYHLQKEQQQQQNNEPSLFQDDDKEGDFIFHVEPLGLVPPKQEQFTSEEGGGEPVQAKLASSTFVRTKLAEWLPISLRYSTQLELIYSTNHHGRSLENFYHRVRKASRHTIMLLEPWTTTSSEQTNSNDIIIGMYASQTWHPSTRVYGDGSCFLFRIDPDENNHTTTTTAPQTEKEKKKPFSQCWKWHPKQLLEEDNNNNEGGGIMNDDSWASSTALLEQFQVSTRYFISMGGNPNGTSGLRLNEDLTKGESSPAVGFDNPPLVGDVDDVDADGHQKKEKQGGNLFEVGLVEVYQLVRQMDGVAIY